MTIAWDTLLSEGGGILASGSEARAEIGARLQAYEERLRLLIESTPVGVAVLDRQMRYLACSRRWISDYHLDGIEMIGKSHYEVFPDIPERWREIHRACLAGTSQRCEHDRFERKDGSIQHLRWAIEPWRDAAGEIGGLIFFAEDITESARVEEALLESQRHYEALIAATPVGVFETDAEGRCSYVNESWSEITGLSLSRAAGDGWSAALHPEDKQTVFQEWDRCARAGLPFRAEYRFQRPSGEIRYVLGQSVALTDQGQIKGFVGTITDLTEQRAIALAREALEEQLRQAQKMESLGTLAGGIAHDFNNLLTAISANLELARSSPQLPPNIEENLDEIGAAADRAGQLVTQILTFSRKQPTRRVAISLLAVVEEVMRLLRSALPPTIRLALVAEPGEHTALADPAQVHQVVMNLVTNARQAIEGPSGTITIRVDRFESEGSTTGPQAGSYVRLRVSDDGRGMDQRVLSRIFEPFFTGRADSQGTGLGLAVVHGIVAAHGGHVTVESAPSAGTTVCVLLPRLEAPPVATARPREIAFGSGQILLIEDQEAVLRATARLLRHLGYRVAPYLDPRAAIDRLLAGPRDFDVVMTDRDMPSLGGLDVARIVHEIEPDLPVILASGSRSPREELERVNIALFLEKPFSLVSLSEALQKTLERR